MKRAALLSLLIVPLAGCAQVGIVLPGQIAAPSSRLMVPPEHLQPVAAGQDLVAATWFGLSGPAHLPPAIVSEGRALKPRQLSSYRVSGDLSIVWL